MFLNESGELLRGHQNVYEIRNVDVIFERDVLFERAVDVAGIFGDHGQLTTRPFG